MSGKLKTPSIIVHIDLDCFFIQVERKINPQLQNKPVALYQHDDIIAVSYEARSLGVKKHDKPNEIKEKYPQVMLVSVQLYKNTTKVSYKSYRRASMQVFKLIREMVDPKFVEKASIDEVYIDLTRDVNVRLTSQLENFDEWGGAMTFNRNAIV